MSVGCRLLFAIATAGLAAGCGLEPGAPLVSLREPPATVLPSEVPPIRADDGFPVILADPATVAGLPRPAAEVAAEQARLEAQGATADARAARLTNAPSNVAALEARGRNHVEETRRRIEASGQPQTSAAPRELPAVAAAPRAIDGEPPDPIAAEPLDPDAPAPRAVGAPSLIPVAAD